MKIVIFGAFLITFVGCSATSNLKVRSVPEGASVSIVEADGSTRSLGQSPIETSQSMHSLIIEKDGYEPARIFVGRLHSENYEYTVKLNRKIEDGKAKDLKDKYERLAKTIAKANNLIKNKRYSEADSILVNLVADYPFVSVGYDLLGNISYLQKDFKRAINYYQKSIELNPENIETKQVLDRLQSMTY